LELLILELIFTLKFVCMVSLFEEPKLIIHFATKIDCAWR